MDSSQSKSKNLHQRGILRICTTVNRAVSIASGMLADPAKTGGYFCLLDLRTGAILTTTIIGSVPPEKTLRYKWLAEEKALRLYRFHTLIDCRHVASYQSRNEPDDKWGGAVLGDRFIYSFSGFPEIYDEAISLAVAHKRKDMPKERRAKIVQFSRPLGDHPAPEIATKLCA